MHGVWVPSLAGELRSHMSHGAAKKKNHNNKTKQNEKKEEYLSGGNKPCLSKTVGYLHIHMSQTTHFIKFPSTHPHHHLTHSSSYILCNFFHVLPNIKTRNTGKLFF